MGIGFFQTALRGTMSHCLAVNAFSENIFSLLKEPHALQFLLLVFSSQ